MRYELSRTEKEIMEFLWENNCPVRTGEIMDYFTQNKGRDWKRQTLNTMLIRLEDKEVIDRRRGIVEAKYTKDQLDHIECKDFVKNKFNDKLSNFITSYYSGEKIPNDEAKDLIDTIKLIGVN